MNGGAVGRPAGRPAAAWRRLLRRAGGARAPRLLVTVPGLDEGEAATLAALLADPPEGEGPLVLTLPPGGMVHQLVDGRWWPLREAIDEPVYARRRPSTLVP